MATIRLLWFALISIADKLCQPSPKCQKSSLRYRTYSESKGILTFFPFPFLQLGDWLGLTYPWLIFIVKEPLPFRWRWFSHRFILTTTRILIPNRSTSAHTDASALSGRLPTIHLSMILSIGDRFSPVRFRGLQPWQVSCYALFKGWLLLSQPPRCLRL